MNGEAFVAAIRVAVRDAAIGPLLDHLRNPPGRRVPDDVRAMSQWLKSLTPDEYGMVSGILEKGVDAAVFGFLCVLDGSRAIEADRAKGTLRLTYVKQGETDLNGPDGPLLHELYA